MDLGEIFVAFALCTALTEESGKLIYMFIFNQISMVVKKKNYS